MAETPAELEELGHELDLLATSREAGYFNAARAELLSKGLDGVGDGEVMAFARKLACTALSEWKAALDLQSTEKQL